MAQKKDRGIKKVEVDIEVGAMCPLNHIYVTTYPINQAQAEVVVKAIATALKQMADAQKKEVK